MALALPARTTELVNHGNALMANFQEQGRSLHQLAFREKEVASKIQALIDNFELKDVIQKAPETIAVLKEAQESYRNIQESVNRIDTKGKELSAVIQQIFQRQQQGESESGNIHGEIARAIEIIAANERQIQETKANLDRMQDELGQLERGIADAERRVRRRRRRRKWLSFLVVGLVALPFLNKDVRSAKRDLGNRRQIFANTQNHFNNLQGTLQATYANKARLDGEQAQRQHELNVIADVLNRLRPAQTDTIQYRQYLLALSDALTEVNSYVQRLERNLNQTAQIQEAEIDPNSTMANTLLESHRGLNETWIDAKERPAFQVTLGLVDPNSVDASLNAIKAANFNG